MFDIGFSELLVIGVVALIVVGPKDLPGMFRTMGRFAAKARAMGREFSRAMEDAAKESGIDATARDLKDLTSKKNLGLDALETAASKFEKWDPMKPSSTPKGPATEELAKKTAATKEALRASVTKTTEKPAAKALAAKKPASRKPTAKPAAPKLATPKLAAPESAAPEPAAKTNGAATPARKAASAKPAAAVAKKPRKAPAGKATT